jgi:hypothetical protein
MVRTVLSLPLSLSLSLLLTSAATLAAQTATITPFGAGCDFLNQTLTIGASGLPQLGTTFTLTYSGPNQNNQLSTQPWLGLGLAATNLPIPQSILPQQPANCTQWIVPELMLPMATTTAGPFEDQVPIVVPNQPALVGVQLTAQWLAFVVQCGIVLPCWLEALPTSDALLLTVGL